MIYVIIGLIVLFIIAKIAIAIAPTKFVNADAGVFDTITYEITIYDDLETAKK